jgi:transposase
MNLYNQKARALELKTQGMSYQQIADEMEIGKTTAYNLLNDSTEKGESKNNGHSSDDNEVLLELKASLADFRDELTQGESNMEVSQLVELRKLELEHEFRMEELELKKKESSFKSEIESLKNTIDSNKNSDSEVRQGINELSAQIANLKSNFQSLQDRNAELEDELSMLERPSVIPGSDAYATVQQRLITRLATLLRNYLDIDWSECHRNKVEEVQLKVLEIKMEFENLDDESIEILNSFLKDIHETMTYFEDDEEVADLYMDNDWKEEMEEWLESVE